jgi:hypothetical protein
MDETTAMSPLTARQNTVSKNPNLNSPPHQDFIIFDGMFIIEVTQTLDRALFRQHLYLHTFHSIWKISG